MTKPVYDYIFTLQEAINIAIAENRVVRFLSDKTNETIRKELNTTENKGCKFLKKSAESNDIAVLPPSIKAFDFEEVDTNSELWLPKGGIH